MKPHSGSRHFLAALIGSISFLTAFNVLSARTEKARFGRSVFISVDFGTNLDLETESRSPKNRFGNREKAYSTAAFHIGINAGYRLSETLGFEAGFHESQFHADKEWGGQARYTLGHVGIRLALPLPTRQTPVLMMGAAIGQFKFGSSTFGQPEDNGTFAVGPTAGLTLEHELMLGLVATFECAYTPLFRKGMSGKLILEEITYDADGTPLNEVIDSKDFTRNIWVHQLWLMVGFQFEWSI